jgi:hypothetical protein
MHFEDYNYNAFNKYILIDPNREPSELEDDDDADSSRREKKLGFSAPPGGRDNLDPNDESARPHLNENLLE